MKLPTPEPRFSHSIHSDSNTSVATFNTIGSSISSGGTTIGNTWSLPERMEVLEYPDRIEFIYKQTSLISYTSFPTPPPEVRVFKIVFSCVDGKWHKSEPIMGKIVPAQNERYEF
jgi:hypothetical protein